MMKACKCGSYAINHHCHGRDGSDDDLCDVCYWRKRAEQPAQQRHISYACPQCHWSLEEQPAQQQEPVAWRELCRRLYVELFHCDWQMTAAWDEEGGPMWQQGATVRDVLADAKAALETSPPAQRTWVGLTDDEIYSVLENLQVMHHRPPTTDSRVIFALAVEAKLKEKNT